MNLASKLFLMNKDFSNKIISFVSVIFLLLPIIAFFSGTSLTFFFYFSGIILVIGQLIQNQNFSYIKEYKFFIPLFLYLIINSSLSIAPLYSFFSAIKLSIFTVLSLVILNSNFNFKIKNFLFVLLIAIIFGLIEIYTNGSIYSWIKIHLLSKENFHFELYLLNRYSVFLSLIATILITTLIKNDFIKILVFLTFALFLHNLDSLSAEIGFIISFISYFFFKFLPKITYKYFRFNLLIYILIFPFIANFFDPYYAEKNLHIPASAIHRIYIWHYVAEKISVNPLNFVGLDASRHYKLEPEEILYPFRELLPNHPHNFVLQLHFELGLIGVLCIIYALNSLLKRSETIKDNNYKIGLYSILTNFFMISSFAYNFLSEWWLASLIFSIALYKRLYTTQG